MTAGNGGVRRDIRTVIFWTLAALVIAMAVHGFLDERQRPASAPAPAPAAVEAEAEPTPQGPDPVAAGDVAWTEWDEAAYPDCYRVVGPAFVDRDVRAGEIQYDGIDPLGRTRRAVGRITAEMVRESEGWRAGFKSDVDSVSGWKGNNKKISVTLPNGGTYNQYCYNRSHLIADSLGGFDHAYRPDGSIDRDTSKSERRNIVTGTRMQNVGQDGRGGMAYCETTAIEYLLSHPSETLYYSATPVYEGDDLLCRSVIVDMKSSDGVIDERVEVFNAQSGCDIDYATGRLTVRQ